MEAQVYSAFLKVCL